MNNMADLALTINTYMENAAKAFPDFQGTTGSIRAAFLRETAKEIVLLGDDLIRIVMEETALPENRVRGERDRTTGQLIRFADLLDEGSWVEAIIDTGDPKRSPSPRPDLRKMLVPLGPVVVFGAGNFPLAFSVAGGDTASALAGGNPVIVKGHPAHPKTGQFVATAIKKAIRTTGVPDGVFALVQEPGYEAGQLLVSHPLTKAGSFTGSLRGGRALMDLAARRPEPVPFFTEMGSTNPVFILKDALRNDAAMIAQKLVSSVNLNAGQFCTNPGLIMTTITAGFHEFIQEITHQAEKAAGAKMFSEQTFQNYVAGRERISADPAIRVIAQGHEEPGTSKVPPVIMMVGAAEFMANPGLREEVFGPFSLIVACDSDKELMEVARTLDGQLTITIHARENELIMQKQLIGMLLQKCGRLILNGVPTGVEVCAAMHHGGPYPSSGDSRFTSVGVSAIRRFVRPVSFQDFPDELLPAELQNANPLHIFRMINNQWTRDKI